MSSARRDTTRVCGAIQRRKTSAWAHLERLSSWQSTEGTQRTPRSKRSAASAPRRYFAGSGSDDHVPGAQFLELLFQLAGAADDHGLTCGPAGPRG